MGGGGYWSDSDSDSDSYTFDALDLDRVQVLGARFGYQQCQLDYGEGVVAFSRPGGGSDGNELVRVWWRTGTVGTYLKGATQLFRREINNDGLMGDIFNNPRRHTGRGYHHTQERGKGSGTFEPTQARPAQCPGCGRCYRSALGTVSHVEQGYCPACPGRDAGRRAVYSTARAAGANFLCGVPQIEYGGGGGDGGYDPDSNNYVCRGCSREFRQLSSLMQHQNAKPACAQAASASSSLQRLGY